MTNISYADNPNKRPVINNDIYFNYYLVRICGSIATVRLDHYSNEPIYIRILIPPYGELGDTEKYADQVVTLRLVLNGRWMGLKKFGEYCHKYRWQVIDEAN